MTFCFRQTFREESELTTLGRKTLSEMGRLGDEEAILRLLEEGVDPAHQDEQQICTGEEGVSRRVVVI
jgi:hypothetical protein